ncbi:MAG: hypothetical protein HOV83_24190, partial [Catenulispora sp.]|nr:hypothetical protein [Catenulispora sp.]
YTGVVGLGLGVGVLYRRCWRFAWLAVPAAFFVAFAEHASWNGRAGAGDAAPGWVGLLAGLTLEGRLSAFLLIGGVAAMIWFEWRRATQARLDPGAAADSAAYSAAWGGAQGQQPVVVPRWLWLKAAESGRRSARLAGVQCRVPQTVWSGGPS